MKLHFTTCVVGLHFVLGACAVTIEPTAERHNGRGGSGPSGTGGAAVGTPVSTAGGASGSAGAAGNGGGPTSGGRAGQGGASGDGGASGTAGTSGGSGAGGAGGTAGSGGTGVPPVDAGASDAGAVSACSSLTEGWTPYQPTMTLQCEGGAAFCNYTNSGGIETFKIIKNPANVRQRLEQRVHNDYRTGMNQFEGDLRVTSGDGTTVHQVFKFLMLVAYPQNGGSLHQHSQTFLASQVFGKWIHVNTIHDTSTGKTDIYFDCVKKTTMNQSPPDAPGGWYDKYGVYNLGGREAQSEWKGVRYYRK